MLGKYEAVYMCIHVLKFIYRLNIIMNNVVNKLYLIKLSFVIYGELLVLNHRMFENLICMCYKLQLLQ